MRTCLCMLICKYGVTLNTPYINVLSSLAKSSILHSYCSMRCNANAGEIIALKGGFHCHHAIVRSHFNVCCHDVWSLSTLHIIV